MKTILRTDTRKRVSSTEMARHFSDYLARVRYSGQSFVVEKNNHPVAELRPVVRKQFTVGEFLEFMQRHPMGPDFADDLEAVNKSDTPLKDPWA